MIHKVSLRHTLISSTSIVLAAGLMPAFAQEAPADEPVATSQADNNAESPRRLSSIQVTA